MVPFSHRMWTHVYRYWPYLLLLCLEIALVATNFKPGTHLVGWDNVFPEFDFGLNLYRDLHAVWQEYRSLGVIDNMAHASNVMLDIQRWVLSWFVSTEANRWTYMFLMHLIGGWGMYHLMSRYVLDNASSFPITRHVEPERNIPKSDVGSFTLVQDDRGVGSFHHSKYGAPPSIPAERSRITGPLSVRDDTAVHCGAKTHTGTTIVIALISAVFYQYALGVIQQFFLPLEVFIQHFAFLPWLVYYMVRILRAPCHPEFISGSFKGSKVESVNGSDDGLSSIPTERSRNSGSLSVRDDRWGHRYMTSDYVKLAFISLMATPQAHVPTVFIVFAMATGTIALVDSIQCRLAHWRRILLIGVILFTTNASWFLPLLYSSITHAEVVAASKASSMASNDLFYRNVKYGQLGDVLLMKGNVLDYQYLDYKTQGSHLMLHPWLDHLSLPQVKVVMWLFIGLALLGCVVSFTSRRLRHARPVTAVFLLAIIMLGADVPLISNVQEFLREHVVLFSTIFRAVFTKFSILMSFGYAVCVGIGLQYSISVFRRMRLPSIAPVLIVVIALVIYVFPAFRGYFFYENLGVRIPDAYFKVMTYMKDQDPGGRILILPAPWYWQWWQPSWGTISSGFIWHGLRQPITELAFTPWSDHNENLYWEFDRAINGQDSALFETLMRKYDISWVMYDDAISLENGKKLDRTFFTHFLSTNRSLRRVLSDTSIQLYQNTNKTNTQPVYLLEDPPDVGPTTAYNDYDQAYLDRGDYITTAQATTHYPYRSLFSYQMPSTQEFQVRETQTDIEYVAEIPETMRGGYLSIDHLHDFLDLIRPGEEIPITITFGGRTILITSYLDRSVRSTAVRLDSDLSGELVVSVPKKTTLELDTRQDEEFLTQVNDACDQDPSGTATFIPQVLDGGYDFRLTSVGTEQCIKVPLRFLSGREGYLFTLTTTADSTRGLYLNFYDDTQKKSGFDTYLDADGKTRTYTFIKSPQKYDTLGYTLYLNNKSEATEEVTNTLHDLRVYRTPHRLLKSIHIATRIPDQATISYPDQATHAISSHQVTLSSQREGARTYLVLSQGYDPAWLAYRSAHPWFPFFGERLTEHMLVNGWANGWEVTVNSNNKQETDDLEQIVIVFWPQYLQYLGYGILMVTGGVWALWSCLRGFSRSGRPS